MNKLNFFKNRGYKIIFINSLVTKNDFKFMFQKLYKKGYARIFLETGLTFLNTLINFKLINILYVLQNNKMLNKFGRNNTSTQYLKNINFKKIKINLYDDILYRKKF